MEAHLGLLEKKDAGSYKRYLDDEIDRISVLRDAVSHRIDAQIIARLKKLESINKAVEDSTKENLIGALLKDCEELKSSFDFFLQSANVFRSYYSRWSQVTSSLNNILSSLMARITALSSFRIGATRPFATRRSVLEVKSKVAAIFSSFSSGDVQSQKSLVEVRMNDLAGAADVFLRDPLINRYKSNSQKLPNGQSIVSLLNVFAENMAQLQSNVDLFKEGFSSLSSSLVSCVDSRSRMLVLMKRISDDVSRLNAYIAEDDHMLVDERQLVRDLANQRISILDHRLGLFNAMIGLHRSDLDYEKRFVGALDDIQIKLTQTFVSDDNDIRKLNSRIEDFHVLFEDMEGLLRSSFNASLELKGLSSLIVTDATQNITVVNLGKFFGLLNTKFENIRSYGQRIVTLFSLLDQVGEQLDKLNTLIVGMRHIISAPINDEELTGRLSKELADLTIKGHLVLSRYLNLHTFAVQK
ncbi:hypothetical protein JW968_05780 [Candidatus Woesearchaeota archaeon]|nr:hypothetical protein [Candidatus Woesearchaeota archaeon]